jgi:predicted anti-sigma-YlaC factor YlaD
MVSSATSDYMKHLSATILNNDDLVLVETGAPAYLLMVDSLISKDPENQTLLTTAGLLYTAYSDIFVHDRERSRKMAAKALGYAGQAVCLAKPNACGFRSAPFETFHTFVSSMEKKHLPVLFALGNAWAGWIMANTDDFNAIADLSRIEIIMQQVIELDPTYRDGAAFLYLGTLASFLPPALGGKPEQGKLYFEKALSLSQGKNLMVKVIYAKLYARMVFNRPLHDRLLQEVIAADPRVEGYTLVNTWAQKQARELIAGGDDYF